jgi:hypothetical protein
MEDNNMSENLLSLEDQAALSKLHRKLHLLRDLATAVVKGFKAGLYLYGIGGIGKSYTVLDQLRRLEAPYVLWNARMTAKGLFLGLKQSPDAVHVLEDMERLTKDADAQGVLRSAMWAQPGCERVVTWTNATEGPQRFVFRGGLILISNRPMADMPELRALATRIEVHMLDATDAELTAMMRELASRGYRHQDKVVIGPQECLEVTEQLLQECRAAGCPLDLRLQQKCFQTYLQWESDWSSTDWRDLIAASVRAAAHHFRHEANTLPREARRSQRRNILREILSETKDVKQQEDQYRARAKGSRADFFRRKREIDTGDFDGEDAA